MPTTITTNIQKQAEAVQNKIKGDIQRRSDEIVQAVVQAPSNAQKGVAAELLKIPGRFQNVVQQRIEEAKLQTKSAADGALQEIADLPGRAGKLLTGVQQRTKATMEAVQQGAEKRQAESAGWIQKGIEGRINGAKRETERFVEDLRAAPTVLGSAIAGAVERAQKAASDRVSSSVDEVKEGLAAQLQSIKLPWQKN